jgi:hypothetical protein
MASTALTLVQTVEGFFEMATQKRWNAKRKWNVVFTVELLKYVGASLLTGCPVGLQCTKGNIHTFEHTVNTRKTNPHASV